MKKLLIPNGSFHEIPLIRKAKELGYYVITSGAAPNGLGHRCADEYVFADFSDKDAILKVAQEKQIDRICSNCNDFGYLSSCYAAEQMGLGGHESYETAEILHKKDMFKKLAKELKLSTPAAHSFGDETDAEVYLGNARYPVMVKPADLGAGQGITLAHNLMEGTDAVRKALSSSKCGRIVIEEYIEGTSHSFNAFVVNGKVRGYYSDNEYMKYSRYRVSTSAGPADKIEGAVNTLIEDTEKVTARLGIADGLMHSQYIMDGTGKPWIIEITRRMSGDWYPYPEMKATGIDWLKYIVMTQTGETVDDFLGNVMQKGNTGRHCLNSKKRGIIRGVRFAPELERNLYDSVLWIEDGFRVENPEKDYPGIIFFDFDDREKMMHMLDRIDDYIEFEYA